MSTLKIITSALVFCVFSIPVFGQDATNINTTNTNITDYTSTNINTNTNINESVNTNTNVNTSTATNTNLNTNVSTNTNTNLNTSTNTNYNFNESTVNSNNNSTSVNTNINESASTSTNMNTNINNNTSLINTNNNNNSTNYNENVNVNQSVSTSDNNINQTSTSTNTNLNQNQTVTDNTNTNYNENITRSETVQRMEQEITSPPPSAIAPSIGSSYSQDLCTTGISGAVQTQIFGLSTGKSVTDENCERIKLSKTLYDMGMRVAAVSLMCQDERVWTAMKMAGTPCPYQGMIGSEAALAWESNRDQVPGYNARKDRNLTSTPNMPRNR